ncbi:hypothetical protein GLW04_02455 [Halobacillus litoralis]|uniref:Uncharacterized protein n=1 Tax=Halobacillus litoralis TaxID=45668 RepID=A0A845DQS5_9BACI|nr:MULTISPECIES: hypothetical protein [Halobacillus]MYL18732.1 hypothetical protein [Halobacillus litoralis]MYL31524.1 hypothetical protein [Halobacillus halophilus]
MTGNHKGFRHLAILCILLSLLVQNLNLMGAVSFHENVLFLFNWMLPAAALTLSIISFSRSQNKKDLLITGFAVLAFFYSIIFILVAWMMLDSP